MLQMMVTVASEQYDQARGIKPNMLFILLKYFGSVELKGWREGGQKGSYLEDQPSDRG